MYQPNLFGAYSTTLHELYGKVDECEKCAYHQINSSRVNGDGAPDASIVVVGQGPGLSEVTTGRPFTGVSGRLLRGIIRDVGIPRKEVYYTNLIRCAAPKDKNIMAKAIHMCKGWLDDTIGIVQPRLIVCLGRVAAQEILGTTSIGEEGGTVVTSPYGIPAIPTWHTAYILRLKKIDRDEHDRINEESLVHWRVAATYVG